MIKITLIKLAFAKWVEESEIEIKKICKELRLIPGLKGFGYSTVNNKLPFTRKKVLEKQHQDKKLSGEAINELVMTIQRIVEQAGFRLKFYSDNDFESCLTDEETLYLEKTTTQDKVASYPENHYFLYFVKSSRALTKDNLIIDFPAKTALLYNDNDTADKRIDGSIVLVNEEVYLLNFLNTARTPYWNITFHKSDSGKDFFIAPFHKISRESDQTAIGEAVIVKANSITGTTERKIIEDMISYYLHNGRAQRKSTKFSVTTLLDNPEAIDNSLLRMWHSLRDYSGTWEGFFPSRQRFENCVIRIDSDGKVKMWIHANTSQSYKGISYRLYDLLIIKYGDMDGIDDFRATIAVDATGHNGQLYDSQIEQSTLYGGLSPITRDWKPATTRFALRKISHTPMNLKDSGLTLFEISLENLVDIKKFDKMVQEAGLKDFFYGKYKPDLYSGWLPVMKEIVMEKDQKLESS